MGRKSIFMLVAPTNEKAAHMALATAKSIMFPGIVLFFSRYIRKITFCDFPSPKIGGALGVSVKEYCNLGEGAAGGDGGEELLVPPRTITTFFININSIA